MGERKEVSETEGLGFQIQVAHIMAKKAWEQYGQPKLQQKFGVDLPFSHIQVAMMVGVALVDPIVGAGLAVVEAVGGRTLITNEELSPVRKGLRGLTGVAGKTLGSKGLMACAVVDYALTKYEAKKASSNAEIIDFPSMSQLSTQESA